MYEALSNYSLCIYVNEFDKVSHGDASFFKNYCSDAVVVKKVRKLF